jgi:hypothetical protein
MRKTTTPNEKRIYLRDVLLATILCVFALVISYNAGKASLKQKHKQVLPSVEDVRINENK